MTQRYDDPQLAELVEREQYYVFPGTNLTVCCLTLRNGFNITGEASCANSARFDPVEGEDLAYAGAMKRLRTMYFFHKMERRHEIQTRKAQLQP